ncbi:MAG TPA: sigma 54-interacting transcriptional regulator [Thermoanaerobacterales bacterium]|nr:sigma 54-interacting transcriptional regulator [Thermoanaerobacterales bacterium]
MNTLFLKAIESSPIFVIADSDGRYVYVNKQWEELVGLDRSEIIGKRVKDIIPNSKIEDVIKSKEPLITGIYPIYNNETPWYGSYTPIMENGQLIGVSVTTLFTDMELVSGFHKQIQVLKRKIKFYRSKAEQADNRYHLDNFIGKSQLVKDMKTLIRQSAPSPSVMLIEGETGTGKEIVAHSIHQLSKRSNETFIKLNCAAIPSELFESELFGYEEGSFTGSRRGGMKGKFELTNKGTIFLDEINHLPLHQQPKLLRVLQEKEIMRVGGKNSIPVDVRIIVASNISLHSLVKQGLLREDLYYRLNVVKIKIPPLRERKEDIPLICDFLIDQLNNELGSSVTGIDKEVLDIFYSHDWPGNVREMRNVLERACNMLWLGRIRKEHISVDRDDLLPSPNQVTDNFTPSNTDSDRELLISVLNKCRWNKTKAAKLLKISRPTLYKRMEKYSIPLNIDL